MIKFILTIIFFFTNISLNAFELSSKTVIIYHSKQKSRTTPAEELSSYLTQILNHKPKIFEKRSYESSAIMLIIDPSHTLKDKKDESFIIKSNQKSITILAKNERGLLYGVYHFLEKYLGCRFLSPNYEYVPHFSSKKLSSNIFDIQEPSFIYREIFIAEADDNIYATKCKLNGHFEHRTLTTKKNNIFTEGININSFSSAELIDQEYSCNGQFDFSNPQAQKKASKKIRSKLQNIEQNSKNYIFLQHEDRDSFCTKNLKNKEFASKTFSQYTKFIASQYPKINFLSQAYLWSKQAPKQSIKFPKNLGIFFSPIEADFSKPLKSHKNSNLLNNLKSWTKVTNNIFVWHYITNFGGYMLPFPDLYSLNQDIKMLSKIKKIKGLFLQGSYSSQGGEFANLRVWVFSKLLWNPNENIDDLIETFCNFYYKEASKDVQLYIKTLHNFIKNSGDTLSFKTPINTKFLNEKNIKKLDEILKNGAKKVDPSSIYAKHLLEVYSGIDYIRLLKGGNQKELKPIKDRFNKFLDNNKNISSFAEGVEIDDLHEFINLKRKKSTPPKGVKNLKENIDWFDYQEYTLSLCCSKIVEDTKASDGISARMNGDQDEWGFQLNMTNFPNGKWDIYASVKIELNQKISPIQKAKMALFYGIYPTLTKGGAIIGQFTNNRYRDIKIGSIDTRNSEAKVIWLSPPNNQIVKYLYIDRIFIIRNQDLNRLYKLY